MLTLCTVEAAFGSVSDMLRANDSVKGFVSSSRVSPTLSQQPLYFQGFVYFYQIFLLSPQVLLLPSLSALNTSHLKSLEVPARNVKSSDK